MCLLVGEKVAGAERRDEFHIRQIRCVLQFFQFSQWILPSTFLLGLQWKYLLDLVSSCSRWCEWIFAEVLWNWMNIFSIAELPFRISIYQPSRRTYESNFARKLPHTSLCLRTDAGYANGWWIYRLDLDPIVEMNFRACFQRPLCDDSSASLLVQ